MLHVLCTDDIQLPGASSASMTMGGSQFRFSVMIVQDTVHEGSIPEQVTLRPISASTPDLLASPVPSVTILIEDNDGG